MSDDEPATVIALVGLPDGATVRGPLYQCWRCPALVEWRDGAWYQRGGGGDRCVKSPTGRHECAPERKGFHGWSHTGPRSAGDERWLLQFGDGPAREVTRAEWIAAETGAGFRGGGGTEPSTQSWSKDGMRGWRERRQVTAAPVPVPLPAGLVAGDRVRLSASGSIPSEHATLSEAAPSTPLDWHYGPTERERQGSQDSEHDRPLPQAQPSVLRNCRKSV